MGSVDEATASEQEDRQNFSPGLNESRVHLCFLQHGINPIITTTIIILHNRRKSKYY